MTKKRILTSLLSMLVILSSFNISVFATPTPVVESTKIKLPNANSIMYIRKGEWSYNSGYYNYINCCRWDAIYIDKYQMRELVSSEGILTSQKTGTEYDFSCVLLNSLSPSARVTTDDAYTVEMGDKNYSSINFVATTRGKQGTDDQWAKYDVPNYNITIKYTDETEEATTTTIFGYQKNNDSIITTTKVVMGNADGNLYDNFNMYEYSIPVDVAKTVKSITFEGNQTPISIFAITGVTDNKVILENKISQLPDEVNESNFDSVGASLEEISALISSFEEKGGNRNDISNIAKYNTLKGQFPNVESVNEQTDKEFVTVVVTFNCVVLEDTVDAYMLEGTDKTVAISKTFSQASDKTVVTCKFKHYRNYDADHTFVVEKGVQNGNGFPMIDAYKKNITLEKPFKADSFSVINESTQQPITDITSLANTEITVSVVLKNENLTGSQGYIVIMGFYGENNELKNCKVATGSLSSSDLPKPESWTFTLPENVSENDNIKCFVVDLNGKTLFNPISFK